MTDLLNHVLLHAPIAAAAAAIGTVLCRYVPWRLGYVVVAGLYLYYVVVISLIGEGVSGLEHASAYTIGAAVTVGLILSVRSLMRGRGQKRSRAGTVR